MRTRRSTAFLGVLAAAAMLTQQACKPAEGPAGDPVTFAAPSESSSTPSSTPPPAEPGKASDGGKPGADQILAGKRQIVIRPVPSSESIEAIDDRGRLDLTDGEAPHSLFVLTPSGDKFLIKTAAAGAGGEPSCLGVKNNGSDPLTVEAAACDAGRAGQLFTITRQKSDSQDRPTYAISNQGAFLQVSTRNGLIAEELGDSPLRTTFAFVDNGPQTLPALD